MSCVPRQAGVILNGRSITSRITRDDTSQRVALWWCLRPRPTGDMIQVTRPTAKMAADDRAAGSGPMKYDTDLDICADSRDDFRLVRMDQAIPTKAFAAER